jgi:hypothetical protein
MDLTTEFNRDNGWTADMSGWDYLVVTLVGPSGTISLLGTNDGGGINGVSEGNSLAALNFTAVQGVKCSDGSAVTVAAAGQTKIQNQGRYLKIGGASAAATKFLVELFKID